MRRWRICQWMDGRRFALGPADGSVEDLSMVNGWWVSCNMVGGSEITRWWFCNTPFSTVIVLH